MASFIENKLVENFKERDSFSREELFDFFKHYEPELKEGTFGWRIYDLKKRNIIKSIKRGYYTISYKQQYKPEISEDILKLSKFISNNFNEVKYCIWNTNWLNEFSRHQATKTLIIIEVEKDFVESIFYEIKDKLGFEPYLNPDEKVINLYISESKKPVVIKKIITRSPLQKQKENRIDVYSPMLEKILVDLIADERLFYFYQGSELINVYKNVIKKYTLNYTKLFSYARRREREAEIKQFMKNHLYERIKNFIE